MTFAACAASPSTGRIGTATGRRWILAMRWHDLLFAHWPVLAAPITALLPKGLEFDTFEGRAWLGVVPFRMSGVRARCTPAMPRVSAFAELNVRTYVKRDGWHGVWFFSLDAAEPLAVRAARWTWGLPYFDARMECADEPDGWIRYRSTRVHRDAPAAELHCRYRPTGPARRAEHGSLEYFLTERYCLFTVDRRGRLRRGHVAHEPWPLQPAEWQIETCEMTRLAGVELPDRPPHLCFARHLSVRAARPVHC